MFKNISLEKKGELLALSHAILGGLITVTGKGAINFISPILAIAIMYLISSLILFPFFITEKKQNNIKFTKNDLFYFLASIVIIIIFSHGLIFWALSKVSAIDSSILIQSETFFTFIFFAKFHEKITKELIIGALLIFLGTLGILFQDLSLSLGIGEICIIIATMIAPFGNYYQKKIVRKFSALQLLFWRNFSGAVFFSLVSLILFDFNEKLMNDIFQAGIFLLIGGIFSYSLAKITFLTSIKYINVSKSIPLALAPVPMFTMIFAFLFLGEKVSFLQFISFLIIFMGIMFITKKPT